MRRSADRVEGEGEQRGRSHLPRSGSRAPFISTSAGSKGTLPSIPRPLRVALAFCRQALAGPNEAGAEFSRLPPSLLSIFFFPPQSWITVVGGAMCMAGPAGPFQGSAFLSASAAGFCPLDPHHVASSAQREARPAQASLTASPPSSSNLPAPVPRAAELASSSLRPQRSAPGNPHRRAGTLESFCP
jgi:hypothetical protein